MTFLLAASSAFAFSPNGGRGNRNRNSALNIIQIPRDKLPGVFYDTYFDPLSLSSSVSDRSLKLWREAELKHGRICMLASVGLLLQELWHPLFGFSGKPLPAPIYHFQEVQGIPGFLPILLVGIAIVEGAAISKYWYTDDKGKIQIITKHYSRHILTSGTDGRSYTSDDSLPGDLNFDPFGFSPDKKYKTKSTYNNVNPEMKSMLSKELNNGRTAMIAVAGFVAQQLVDGRGVIEHWREFGLGPAV